MSITTINSKSTKSERTQKKIIHEYLQMMTEQKWNKISVKELCANVDITRGTFYQYYSDIYELMEQIQNDLIGDLTLKYEALSLTPQNHYLITDFLEEYDCSPPEMFRIWFEFCREQKEAIRVLLNPYNGDPYFEQKLKKLLNKYIEIMMNNDGLPNDELRSYFISACSELHLVTIHSWISKGCTDEVPMTDIIHLLNTMRIGAAYLIYKGTR